MNQVNENNFQLKTCLFVTVKLVRNAIKRKFTYNGQGKAFDGERTWNFGNDFARNIVNFGFDGRSSSHTDNRKNNFLVIGEGPHDGINDSTGAADFSIKIFGINLRKANTKFCLILHYNGDKSHLYVNKTEISKFKEHNNISQYNFWLGSQSKDFPKDQQSEFLLMVLYMILQLTIAQLKMKTFLILTNIQCLI